MSVVPIVLLVVFLAVVALFVRKDLAEYEQFKELIETADRQRMYARWVWQSCLLFGIAPLAALASLGRLDAVWRLPAEFAHLRPAIDAGSGMVRGFMIGALVAVVIGVVAGAVMGVRRTAPGPVAVGDIEPLMPRNSGERFWAALVSINAGLSEELAFRLLLPLLFTLVTGNALLSLALSALVFGLVHLYQGRAGVVATTCMVVC